MAKAKTTYVCMECGYQTSKWMGKCGDCGGWNTFVEEVIEPQSAVRSTVAPKSKLVKLSEVSEADSQKRLPTGSAEFDRVLGGGIFPASVILLAGEPGIGKSTLMLQTLLKLQQSGHKTVYVSGEESLQQLKNRANRLPVPSDDLLAVSETNIEAILHHIEKEQPDVVVADSIQALYNSDLSGAPGNVGQVRDCAARLFKLAKEQPFTLFLIGHVTKDGSVAGPKILEHLVDVVIYFEGNTQQHRIIRAVKNRFGAANELGVFEMRNDGLREVSNVSGLFLNVHEQPMAGSSIVCSYEGSRPLMVEVQALVSRSNYGTPQRTVSGFDHRRLSLILAILEKYCRLSFGIHDVFVKVAGGLRIEDPGIDLGVAAALYSSRLERPLENDAVYIGELGLGGEVRPVSFMEQRLGEAQKLGFRQSYLPVASLPDAGIRKKFSLMLSPVRRVNELLLPGEES
ncbi:MAG: DNA repair protein RadA [Calditrichia bacterium]